MERLEEAMAKLESTIEKIWVQLEAKELAARLVENRQAFSRASL